MIFYGTNKMESVHNYVSVYQGILRGKENNNLKILEIVMYRRKQHEQIKDVGRSLPGASLRTQYDYLPNAEIYGIDLGVFKDVDNDRIKTFVCNQESKEQLATLIRQTGSNFHIIIDDGCHTMKQHQISISVLFKHLKTGGVYGILNLHTYEIPHYVGADLKTTKMLRNFQVDGKIRSCHIKIEESIYLKKIQKVFRFLRKSEIAVICKK